MAFTEWGSEANLYTGLVPGIPGAHFQGATRDEFCCNLQEVLELCLEEVQGVEPPLFVGVQQINVEP